MSAYDLTPLPGEPPEPSRMPEGSPGPLHSPDSPGASPATRARPTWWSRFPSTRILWLCLFAGTLLGGFLRFWRLDYQAYWTDEAHTVERIQGTFAQMLQSAESQGFPPGWYAAIRWWCQFVAAHLIAGSPPGEAFVPLYTRILPAILGTLTVPAMYFLARQFTDRRGALLVMLLTAVNPYLIYYARDIKMYAALWFFVVLNSAIFFQWLTSQKHLLWLPLYVVTGILMLAMHVTGEIMIALHLIFLLTRPRPRPWDAALWAIAAGLIIWWPLYWHQSEGENNLSFIRSYTDMDWHVVAGLPTAHLLGYLWPSYPPNDMVNQWFMLGDDFPLHLATRSWEWMARWQLYAAWGLFAILLVGLIPWRGIRRTPERLASVTRGRWWWILIWIAVPTAICVATWIPVDSDWYARLWQGVISPNHRDIWEPRYLGFIVPAWLLWLGASLRRLPTMPLRALAIAAVVGACGFSALSNHLLYRNAPFQRVAAAVMRNIDPQNPRALATAVPQVHFPSPAMVSSMNAARKVVPTSAEARSNLPAFAWTELRTPAQHVAWLRSMAANGQIHTIVMADRFGDLTDPADPLSSDSLKKVLGDKWQLVDTELFEWHYEWRFYIFHTWRIRVWKRSP